MTNHRCYQSTRLMRIERDEAAREAKYRERDEVLRRALLELGQEMAAIGANVSRELTTLHASTGRQLRAAHARITDLAKRVKGKPVK